MIEKQKRTILVVDDDLNIIEMLSLILTEKGYRVIAVDSAEKALKELREKTHDVDVVFADVWMPGLSGIELLESVHSFNPDLPVILMTAYADMETMEVAIRQKVFDFITKPLNLDELTMTLEKVIKHVTLLELEQNYIQTLEETVENRTSELHSRHEELHILFRQVEAIKLEWERTMDCVGDIVILADTDSRIRRCNRALRDLSNTDYQDIIGNDWRSFLGRHGLDVASSSLSGSELYHEPSRRWFILNAYPFTDPAAEAVSGLVITIVDTSELKQTTEKLASAYKKLQTTQEQMFQREKMASIGQLAAGVAHEINNPIGFISSNLATLNKYVERLSTYIGRQAEICTSLMTAEMRAELEKTRIDLKIDHILTDISPLIAESLDGADRVRTIVRDLKGFSRTDEGAFQESDIIACLESAVNIVWNELKYKATLRKNYSELPAVKCYPQQLNQVFMNLLINAADAIYRQGEVTIDAYQENNDVFVVFSDTGSGINPENLNKIFEPFFTTKDSGKGTGLGLSISYEIIKKHQGDITVTSIPGEGTSFTVRIPVTRE